MTLILTGPSAWQGQANLMRLRGGLQAEWLRMTRGPAEPPDHAAPFIAALGPGWSPDITLNSMGNGHTITVQATHMVDGRTGQVLIT